MSTYHKLNLVSIMLVLILVAAAVRYDISWKWYALVGLSYVAVCAIGSFILSWEFFMRVRTTGNAAPGQVALTFDDGPLPGNTERVLAILEAQNVKAAFFCIGARMIGGENLVTRIHEAGHIIGNHSFHHKKVFGFLAEKEITKELSETDNLIARATGRTPRLFRPPFGVTSPMIAAAVQEREYVTVGWSIRSFDSVIRSPERLYRRISTGVKAGDIVLFHDYSEAMISILPRFIQFLRKEGFEPVRLDKLLNEDPYR